jgi:hypothetical protein
MCSGQQGVAEQNSQLPCVQPVEHERVDSVEESGAEARGEHRGAHQARRPGRGKREEDRGRYDRASLPEEAIEEVEADRERHSLGQATATAALTNVRACSRSRRGTRVESNTKCIERSPRE